MENTNPPCPGSTQLAQAIPRLVVGIVFACGGDDDDELVAAAGEIEEAFEDAGSFEIAAAGDDQGASNGAGRLRRNRAGVRRKKQEHGERTAHGEAASLRHLPEVRAET
jgi:UDP-N-acetylmuramyl tripeptide synthase